MSVMDIIPLGKTLVSKDHIEIGCRVLRIASAKKYIYKFRKPIGISPDPVS